MVLQYYDVQPGKINKCRNRTASLTPALEEHQRWGEGRVGDG